MHGCAFSQYVKLGWYPFMNTMRKLLLALTFFENNTRGHVQLAAGWYIFCLWRTLLRYPSFMTFWESGWKCLMEIVWKLILLKLGFAFLGNGVCLQALHKYVICQVLCFCQFLKYQYQLWLVSVVANPRFCRK